MVTSDSGLALIQEFEGCVLHAYPDPATDGEPWTIGYGRAHGVSPGQVCTREQAVQWLREDVRDAERSVTDLVRVPLAQNQFDALVSFTFNLGANSLMQSTLLRLLNAGTDPAKVSPQFLRWVNGPNGPMPGLMRRRAAEKAMFDGASIHAEAA